MAEDIIKDGQLKIYFKEIYFDVQNETWLTGKTKKAEVNANYEAAANMQASDDSDNAYKLHRSISNAYNTIKGKMGEYVKDVTYMSNNLIKRMIKDNEYVLLRLNLPTNYNYASFDALSAAIHDYIVKRAVYEFFNITNTGAAATYKVMAEDALAVVREAISSRRRPQHREEYYDSSVDGNPTVGDAGEMATEAPSEGDNDQQP